MGFLERVQAISDVIIDGYFVLDAERTILAFNQAFHAMLPRAVSRGLVGKKCYETLDLEICKERCIAQQCWQQQRHIRLDEISGRIAQTDQQLTFILSALPFFNDAGQPEGALIIQRNVTDEAQVQSKYQEVLEQERRERERLRSLIQLRTRDLLRTSDELFAAQHELLELRRHRLGIDLEPE